MSGPERDGRWVAMGLVLLGIAGIVYTGITEVRRLAPVAENALAPPFRMARWAGGEVSRDDLKGKVVMLDFWATWCGPCAEEMPSLLKLSREYADKGVVFVAASRDDPATWKVDVGLFADRVGKELTEHVTLADEATSAQFRIEVLPTLFFIGPSGRIIESYSGYAPESELRRRIERARGTLQ